MTKKDLQRRLGQLESCIDQLETEILHADELLRLVGFAQGLKSVKEAALELLTRRERETNEMV